ncbi:MAG: TonB-dependent receptor [Flammeovirgaceae bacterium]
MHKIIPAFGSVAILYVFILIFGIQHQVTAQKKKLVHKLKCKVYDAKTKEALPQANVQLINVNKGAVTDQNGMTELQLNEDCACTLKISFIGYKDFYTVLDILTDTTISVYLNENTELLESVEIADSRLPSTISSLTTSQVDAHVLEGSRGEAISYSLEKIAGVSTLKSGSGNIAKPVIHGLYGNRIMILYNGVRMEGQQWGTEHAPELDPFVADNLAVIKGAASVRYGANAIGGVVVVDPADLPTEKGLKGKANLVGFSNGRTLAGALQLENGFKLFGKDGWGWRLQTSAKRGGDLHAPDYQLTNTGVREMNYSASVGYTGSKWGWEAFYSSFGTELGILAATNVGNLDDLEYALTSDIPPGTTDFSYDFANPRQDVNHDLFKFKTFLDAGLGKWTFQYALQLNRRKEFDVRRGALNDIPSMNLEITTHTAELDLEHRLSENIRGNIGISGIYQDNNNVPGTQRSNFIPNFNSFSGGIYLIEKWQKNKWQLEFGTRFDFQTFDIAGWNSFGFYYDNFQTQNLTATLGAIYQLSDASSFSMNIGTSWRPPHVAELYSYGKHQSNGRFEYGLLWTWEQTGTNFEFFIDEFDPERIKNEQGIKWVGTYNYETERTFIELSAYVNHINNFIYARPQGITNSTAGIYPYTWYRQTDALFTGLDFTATHQLSQTLTWSGQASLVNAKDLSNTRNHIINIPASRFVSSLQYDLTNWKGLTDIFIRTELAFTARKQNTPRAISFETLRESYVADIDLFAEDDTDFDYMEAPDAYLLGNIELGFTKPIKESALSFRLKVQNLANTRYRDYTNQLRYFADDLGRNTSISLLYKFR